MHIPYFKEAQRLSEGFEVEDIRDGTLSFIKIMTLFNVVNFFSKPLLKTVLHEIQVSEFISSQTNKDGTPTPATSTPRLLRCLSISEPVLI